MDYLLGKTLEELNLRVSEMGLARYTASQICAWLYKKQVSSIEEMTNLSQKNRELLSANYSLGAVLPSDFQQSVDGTKKYLFPIPPNYFIESVYIPDKERATLCVSSQVGCKMNCLFCTTGKQGFQKHLSSGDIINQIRSIPESNSLSNIVFMGMGEPFDNIDEVLKSCRILTSEWGFGWSPRRITVSTIGHLSGMERFLEESECHLAISLHATTAETRQQIMPLQKAYPLNEIIQLVRQYNWEGQRRLSFEYILFKGLNDTPEDAERLVKWLSGIRCRVNLIRFHRTEDVALEGSDSKTMTFFRDYLTNKGITTTIRASRGEDILAACGMLSSKKQG